MCFRTIQVRDRRVEVGEYVFTIGDTFTIGEQHNDSEGHVDVVPLQCQVHLTGAPVHTCPTCITPQREEVQGNIKTDTAIQVAMMCKKCTETRKKFQNLRRQNNRLKHVIRTLREDSEINVSKAKDKSASFLTFRLFQVLLNFCFHKVTSLKLYMQ